MAVESQGADAKARRHAVDHLGLHQHFGFRV
jgi:hypothetical protein